MEKRVNVSDLKAHLSAYLARARSGETIVVCDRKTPIATLGPMNQWSDDFIILPPRARTDLRNIQGVPPRKPTDVVRELREERDAR